MSLSREYDNSLSSTLSFCQGMKSFRVRSSLIERMNPMMTGETESNFARSIRMEDVYGAEGHEADADCVRSPSGEPRRASYS